MNGNDIGLLQDAKHLLTWLGYKTTGTPTNKILVSMVDILWFAISPENGDEEQIDDRIERIKQNIKLLRSA